MYSKIKVLLSEVIELNNEMWDLYEKEKIKEALELSKTIEEKISEARELREKVFSNAEEVKKYMYQKQQEGLFTPENKEVIMSEGKYIINTDE